MLFHREVLLEAKKPIKADVEDDATDYVDDVEDDEDDPVEDDDADATDYTEEESEEEATDDVEDDSDEGDVENTEDSEDDEESTDYTDDETDLDGDETEVSDDGAEPNEEPAPIDDKQYIEDKQNALLIKDFIYLYQSLREVGERVSKVTKNDLMTTSILTQASKNISIMEEQVFNYIQSVFSKNSYVYNLYIYNTFIENLKIIVMMLTKMGELNNDKIKQYNKNN